MHNEIPAKPEVPLLEKFANALYKVILTLCILFLAAQVLVTCYSVFGRFVFNKTPPWADEMARLFMVWMSLLSASLAVRDNTHVRMTFLDKLFGKKGVIVRDIVFSLINISFSAVLFWKGVALIGLTHKTKLPGSGLPSSFLYGAACIGGLFLMLMLIYRLGVLVWRRKA